MKLTHVGISYYRSIGEAPVMLDLTKKINVLVGANNSGKSNVLGALLRFAQKTDNEIDHHMRNIERPPQWFIHAHPNDTDSEALKTLPNLNMSWTPRAEGEAFPQSPLSSLSADTFSPIWYELRDNNSLDLLLGRDRPLEVEALPTAKIECSARLWSDLKQQLPKAYYLPQFRKLSTGDKVKLDGTGLITQLSQWQNAKIGEDRNLRRFQKIQRLIGRLLNIDGLVLNIDHEKTNIIIDAADLRLPLDSYGTGIHELIILAIAVISFDHSMICIEEPEIHLHPLLQRRFVEFLLKETTNRYIITTHSPALITPAEDINVIHLWLEDGVTKSRTVETTADTLRALHDLGAQASDLLQANSVIWVEGPSDRTYLNRWLKLLHPGKYREGIDYTVMFYGGRLLSHLSMDRDPVAETKEDEGAELIQLLKINQHSAILIDSDRRKAADVINPTKERIKTECAASGVFCWITSGREIENCLPAAAINAAFSALAGKPVSIKLKPYQEIEAALATSLEPVWQRAKYYEHAKAQRAHEISVHMTADQLSQEVRDLVAGLVKVIEHKLR